MFYKFGIFFLNPSFDCHLAWSLGLITGFLPGIVVVAVVVVFGCSYGTASALSPSFRFL